jgi:4-carboxymuconolactone decarboxylase
MRNRNITAMVAHGQLEELAVGASALSSPMAWAGTRFEEILLQTAIYGGVFSTNTAFKTAQQVFREMDTTP